LLETGILPKTTSSEGVNYEGNKLYTNKTRGPVIEIT